MKIGVIVNYSTIDHFLWSKLRPMVEAVSDDLVVVRKTHLFNGEPEELHDLGVPTLTMPHIDGSDPMVAFKIVPQMRYAGISCLSPGCTHYLLLDSDELFEVDRMKAALIDYSAPQFFHARWYWRDANHCAVQSNEGGAFLCRANQVVKPHDGVQMSRSDRASIAGHKSTISRSVGVGNPFCHHFSWAKPLPNMLRKVKSWGHKGDRNDWVANIEREWALPQPSKVEFVHRKPVVDCDNVLGVRIQ